MAIAEHADVSEAPGAHSTSSQHHIVKNDDPALDQSHEHTHVHMHHDKHAEQGRKDEVSTRRVPPSKEAQFHTKIHRTMT